MTVDGIRARVRDINAELVQLSQKRSDLVFLREAYLKEIKRIERTRGEER